MRARPPRAPAWNPQLRSISRPAVSSERKNPVEATRNSADYYQIATKTPPNHCSHSAQPITDDHQTILNGGPVAQQVGPKVILVASLCDHSSSAVAVRWRFGGGFVAFWWT